ncbi:rhomboid family intramembrane serine protease [Haloferax gibbonsii]|nr:rhomboid family intramembrane serine protease [Haloferax gibbonsii]
MDDWSRTGSAEVHPGAGETIAGGVVKNPVTQTLMLMFVVSTATWVSAFAGFGRNLFVLTVPLSAHPWTLVTSVYAHLGPGHLFSNAVLLIIAGGLVSLSTSAIRFHVFFVLAGAAAGSTQVLALHHRGLPIGVLGASGAVFALIGYILTSNLLSKFVLDRLDIPWWAATLGVVFVAALLTMQYSAPGSALLAHFAGAVLGLAAGRLRLLHV